MAIAAAVTPVPQERVSSSTPLSYVRTAKSESEIKVEIEDNETRKTLLSGIYYLGNYGKSKMTFNVFPWIQTCDYGDLGVTVRVFSNDISILEFKYYSSVCD